jgi:hypothetical protein
MINESISSAEKNMLWFPVSSPLEREILSDVKFIQIALVALQKALGACATTQKLGN